jgi:hypothetical protein
MPGNWSSVAAPGSCNNQPSSVHCGCCSTTAAAHGSWHSSIVYTLGPGVARFAGEPGPRCLLTCVATGALQGGQLDPIDLLVEERFHRAAPGGNGAVKAAGNYSPVRMGGFRA